MYGIAQKVCNLMPIPDQWVQHPMVISVALITSMQVSIGNFCVEQRLPVICVCALQKNPHLLYPNKQTIWVWYSYIVGTSFSSVVFTIVVLS